MPSTFVCPGFTLYPQNNTLSFEPSWDAHLILLPGAEVVSVAARSQSELIILFSLSLEGVGLIHENIRLSLEELRNFCDSF